MAHFDTYDFDNLDSTLNFLDNVSVVSDPHTPDGSVTVDFAPTFDPKIAFDDDFGPVDTVSPYQTRPSSPSPSDHGSDASSFTESDRARMLSCNLATSDLPEEEKERIRREKKREADRKCRKRKKEKVNDMESVLKKLKDDKKEMALRIQQLESLAGPAAPVTPTASPSNAAAASKLATSIATLFNASIVSVAAFVRDHTTPTVSLISPSLDTTGRDSLVKFYIGIKAQFPNSTLTVNNVHHEGDGKFDVCFTIRGMLSNGRPLTLPGHFFVSTGNSKIHKVVGMWNETSVLAQQFGLELSEWKKKADGASFFEDFWL